MWFKKKKKRELINVVSWLSKNRLKYDLVRLDDKVIVTAYIYGNVFDIFKEGESLFIETFEEEKREATAKEIISRLKKELRW